MKVKIDNKIYDSKEDLIMLILTDYDKEKIKNIPPGCDKFFFFPENRVTENIISWIDDTIAVSTHEITETELKY